MSGHVYSPDDLPLKLTRIVLRPLISVRGKESEERILKLCDLAHGEWHIANSLTAEITLEPRIQSG